MPSPLISIIPARKTLACDKSMLNRRRKALACEKTQKALACEKSISMRLEIRSLGVEAPAWQRNLSTSTMWITMSEIDKKT